MSDELDDALSKAREELAAAKRAIAARHQHADEPIARLEKELRALAEPCEHCERVIEALEAELAPLKREEAELIAKLAELRKPATDPSRAG